MKRPIHVFKEFDEEIDIFGTIYRVSFIASGDIVNCGIGPYEFWGRHGVDVHYGIEEYSIKICDIYSDDDPLPHAPWPRQFIRLVEDMMYEYPISDKIVRELEDSDRILR